MDNTSYSANANQCVSSCSHDERISNIFLHYSGCLRFSQRQSFLQKLPRNSRLRLERETKRVDMLRRRLELLGKENSATDTILDFQLCLDHYRESKGWPLLRRASGGLEDQDITDHDVDSQIRAPIMCFKNGQPLDMPRIDGTFPSQKIVVKTLLGDNNEANPLMHTLDDNIIRYVHLPANNMSWVEKAISRYFHEKQLAHDEPYLSNRYEPSMTKTQSVLRPEFWALQRGYNDHSPVHARNMRPFCDSISTEDGPKIQAMALFMPYLGWETDHGRKRGANKIKQVNQERGDMTDAVDRAVAVNKRNIHSSRLSKIHDYHQKARTALEWRSVGRSERRRLIGHILLTAAMLLEIMDSDIEGRLVTRYLHDPSPLHPRRTLDQSHYGALRHTGIRDRDQVVYRATSPSQHDHVLGDENCQVCQDDSRKVPRLIMVDQLWLWILDESTVISCFPRRLSKHRSDPTDIHKILRQRLKHVGKNEIQSVFDLALLIIDQCSRSFFERARPRELKPDPLDIFADAIRSIDYKQTAAYDDFLIYTHLASRDYGPGQAQDALALNRLLNINPEGDLLKECKDIMDEIHILIKIESQQQMVMETYVQHIKKRLWARDPEEEVDSFRPADSGVGRWTLSAQRTLHRAEVLLEDIHKRIQDLQSLLRNAEDTSKALKDLLTLKQQQAGVIEAREAVKSASETVRQGQSIMLFTSVTIIFLPLSFCTSLFGMNAVELNDGSLTLAQEFTYTFPISLGVILISFVLAFSQTALTNTFAKLAYSAVSLVYNTAATWLAVHTGLFMLGRKAAANASMLREREARVTGTMKAEVLQRKANLKKMQAMQRIISLPDEDDDNDDGGDGGSSGPADKQGHTRSLSSVTLGGARFEVSRKSTLRTADADIDVELGVRRRAPS
ncbi:hypothetical protein F4809DRAFT_660759 [Biscogniauxia mediterranea]|nr:hypothetical protein F4809DRAFT_660759 [Biscogniauxia mediterranea]